eukprot:TRINITY_DN15562_c0_g1_i1.p1 TRINITY_DN15562_c0_g1~~TRINITY_DN15562_c0_g1_i1.p1  ORF type:complete len:1046 (-),score=123.79 TRINITY_DN15562_c0_g1_i1:55-3192(-)
MDVQFPEFSNGKQFDSVTLVDKGEPNKALQPCCGFLNSHPSVQGRLGGSAVDRSGDFRLRAVAAEPSIGTARRGGLLLPSSDLLALPATSTSSAEIGQRLSARKGTGFDFRKLMKKILELDEDHVVGLCDLIFISFPKAKERLLMKCPQEERPPSSLAVECFPVISSGRSEEKAVIDEQAQTKGHVNPGTKQNCMEVEATIYGEDVDVQATASKVNQCSGNVVRDHTGLSEREALQEKLLLRDMATLKRLGQSLPTIQFEMSDVYVRECEGKVHLTVLRIGGPEYVSTVSFETRNGTALAGSKYQAHAAELVFKEGQRTATITVDLVDDDCWDATLTFHVVLLRNSCQNAQISLTGGLCNVRILDDDTFPSNWSKEDILAGKMNKVGPPRLFFEYCKMNLKNSVVKRGAVKTVLVDQFSNIVFLSGLVIDFFLMERILCSSCIGQNDSESPSSLLPWSRYEILLIVSFLRAAPFPLSSYLNYRKVYFRVSGQSRKKIQSNLLRKFLSYTKSSHEIVCESYFQLAMIRDASDLVESGFCKVFELLKNVTRLILVLIFQVLRNEAIGQKSAETFGDFVTRILPVFLFPFLFVMFLKCRNMTTVKYLEAQQAAQNAMMETLRHILGNYDLIRDYGKKGDSAVEFDKSIAHYNAAFVNCRAVIVNNKAFSQLVTAFLLAFYTIYGGGRVLRGLSLGKFVSTLQVYTAIGVMMDDVYDNLLDFQNTFESLRTIVRYMNLPLDLDEKLELARSNKTFVDEIIKGMPVRSFNKREENPVDPVDLLFIELRDVRFRYKHGSNLTCDLKNISASMPQGGLYALVGPPSQGKGTLLKILCGVIMPGLVDGDHAHILDGVVSVPTHLRVLNVLSTPAFVGTTLLDNLCLGVYPDSNDGAMDRVLSICRRLRVSEATLQTLEQNTTSCDWTKTLSATEASLLHIARGLIANPEVLCIHKPTLYLQADSGLNLYDVLNEFVTQRGLLQDMNKFQTRRPRTCIVTARSTNVAELVDAAFHVSSACGMVRLLQDTNGRWSLSSEQHESVQVNHFRGSVVG